MYYKKTMVLDILIKDRCVYLFGVGGGGCNALSAVKELNLPNLVLVALNSDDQNLERTPAGLKFQLGANLCKGLGAGANPDIGAAAFQESIELLDTFKDTNALYCVLAGLGGGTGSGAAPLLVKALKHKGLPTTAILTMPFAFEGTRRSKQAEEALAKIRSVVNAPIVINNQDMLSILGKNVSLLEAFKTCDEACNYVVTEILSMITNKALQSLPISQRVGFFEMISDVLQNAFADIEKQLSIRGDLLHYQPKSHIIVPDNNPQLLKAITLDQSLLKVISPRKFEELLCCLYELAGFKVTLTQQSRDRGADLLVYMPSPIFGQQFLTVVQAKKYNGKKKVSEHEIRDLFGSQFIFNAHKAQCITTIGYTKPAEETANKLKIDLALFSELLRLIEL